MFLVGLLMEYDMVRSMTVPLAGSNTSSRTVKEQMEILRGNAASCQGKSFRSETFPQTKIC